jgi:hypothetical protein
MTCRGALRWLSVNVPSSFGHMITSGLLAVVSVAQRENARITRPQPMAIHPNFSGAIGLSGCVWIVSGCQCPHHLGSQVSTLSARVALMQMRCRQRHHSPALRRCTHSSRRARARRAPHTGQAAVGATLSSSSEREDGDGTDRSALCSTIKATGTSGAPH